jgi:hypothetical protein
LQISKERGQFDNHLFLYSNTKTVRIGLQISKEWGQFDNHLFLYSLVVIGIQSKCNLKLPLGPT